jgi:dTDP-4-amino-4,6-dideoxygalactose transaminase
MEAIMAIAKEHNLYVIEDNARWLLIVSFLLESKESGTIGHVGSTSFFHLKI